MFDSKNKGAKVILERDLAKIKKIFKEDKEVLLAYLFGSQASGLAFTSSDLDFAVLLKEGNTKYYLKKEKELTLKLLELSLGKEIDVVLLNVAGIELVYKVVTGGKLLLSRDDLLRVNFEEGAILDYFDIKPFLDEYSEHLYERIKAG